MKIDLIDLKKRFNDEGKDLLKIINKVASKGNLVLTSELESFEQDICRYTNSKYCLGLNSGTDALMMSLWSLGIGKGDEVITTPVSFVATIGAIIHVGAKPVLVDVKDDLNIDCDLIEKKITKKTKAIMPVHWAGRPCDMDKLVKICKKYKLKLIEDAAQGMGSYYKKKHLGTFGNISAFSCHPLKNLNALGDGGFIITNEKKLYEKIKKYRTHGITRDHVEIFGVNSRLDVINSEVLRFRLKKLKNVIIKRTNNIKLYKKLIKAPEVKIISEDKKTVSSHVMFITLCKNRDNLKSYLEKNGIQTLVYYGTPLHKHVASKKIKLDKVKLPKAEKLCEEVLAFPHHQYLTTKEISFVCKKINEFYKY